VDLRQLLLCGRLRLAARIEQDGARAGGALVDGQDEALLRHDPPPFSSFPNDPRPSAALSIDRLCSIPNARGPPPMAQNSRQQQILDLVRQRGFMSIEAL